MYNIRTERELGPKRAMVRMIPCGCAACVEQLKRPWDSSVDDPLRQERYKQNRECKLWPIFEGINDWRIAEVQETSATDPQDLEDLYAEVLGDAAAQMEEAVQVGNYGAQGVDGDEYYLVRFNSTPYTLQEDTTSHNQVIKAGERVCNATYLYSCHRARNYYRNAIGEEDSEVMVKMGHLVDADVKMVGVDDFLILPQTMRRQERLDAVEAGAYLLSEESHSRIIGEMHRRNRLDHEEILVEEEDMEEAEQIMRNDDNDSDDE